MSASTPSKDGKMTSSQKKKRLLSEIQADLEQFNEEDLFSGHFGSTSSESTTKRAKQAENDPSQDKTIVIPTKPTQASPQHHLATTSVGNMLATPSNSSPTRNSNSHTSSNAQELSEEYNPPALRSFSSTLSEEDHAEPHMDLELASEYLARIAVHSNLTFATSLNSDDPIQLSGQSTYEEAPQDVKKGAKEDSGDLTFYVVTRVHHSKQAKEFERLKRNLKNARQMVVVGYTTSGDCGKELLSSRSMKDLPKNVMVPAMNTKEALQLIAIRIDDAMEVFELEIAPQSSNAFSALMKSKDSGKPVEAHFNLLWDILKRKAIPESTQLVIYNTQRLLRLVQMSRNVEIAFRSFEEPPLDPFVAGFVINPEMGVEPDADRSALSMRAYEFESMMRAFCPAIKIATKIKNHLAYDTFHTRDLALALWPVLHNEELVDAFMFEMRVSMILSQMEVPGMRVDLDMLSEPRRAIDAKLRDLGALANQIVGYNLLLSSPSQVSEAIYTGLEDYIAGEKSRNSALKKTSSGKHQSTKEAALLELKKRMKADGLTNMKQYKICEIVLEHRPIHKLMSFLDAIEQTAEKSKDPRFRTVYPRWLQCNTGTGRVTGASPNMQTQPTTDEIRFLAFGSEDELDTQAQFLPTHRIGSSLDSGPAEAASATNTIDFKINIRSAYVSRPGFTLVGADYSQIEMRILAQVSGDEDLVKFFKTGMDIHRQVASRVFKCSPEQISSQQREWCKRIVYGIVYGMGIQALSKSLDISTARGKEFYDSFMGSFPRVQSWINGTRAHIRSAHFVRTMLGRVRRITPGGGADAGKYLRQGVNTTIQGSAADIVKIAMVKIDKDTFDEKVDAKLLLQIHDELIYEVKDSDIDKFKVIMKRCMEQAVPHFDVPLVINIESGHSWGLMQP